MTEYFRPPAEPGHRTKTPFCRSVRDSTGERCSLYVNHYGNHKGNHLATEWTDAESREEQP